MGFIPKWVLFLVLSLVLLSSVFALTQVGVISPLTGQNLSGTTVLNVTTNAPAVNVSFIWVNASNGVIIYIANTTNATSINNTAFNISTFDTTVLADGIYNLTVNATNSTRNSTLNTSVNNVTIDNAPPNVLVFNSPAANANLSNAGTQVLNVTVNDTTLAVGAVQFNVSNGSGFVLLNASNPGGEFWNASLNLSTLVEENHTLQVLANDTLGNLNRTEFIFFVSDGTVPNVSLETVNGTNTTDSTPDLSFNFTDEVFAFASCTLVVDNVSSGTNLSVFNGTSTGITTNSTLGNGAHSWYVNCTDGSGNVGTTAASQFTVTVDTVPPNVLVFNSPAANANLSNAGTQVLNVTVNDTTLAVGAVQFNVSNGSGFVLLNASNPGGEFWNASLDLSTLVEENHTLQVLANDTLGNLNRTEFIFFVSDGTVPNVSLETVNGTNTTDSTPDLSFNFTDEVFAFASCTLVVDNVSSGTNASVFNGTSTGITTNSTLGNGAHSWYVNCTDGSGNVGTTAASQFTVTVDTVPPNVLVFNSPAANSNLSNAGVQVLNVTVNDTTLAVGAVQFNVSNGSGFVLLNASNPGGEFWNASLDLSTLVEENHTLQVLANDTLGNLNRSESIFFVSDGTVPNVSLETVNLTNFTTLSPAISFNFTDNVFGFASCSVFVDEVLNGTNASTQNGTSTSFTLGPLGQGNHSYYVNCTDGSSNVGMSGINNLTVDTLPPSVVDLVPVSNTTFNFSDTIEIAANVTDATSPVGSAYVNITFPNGTLQQVNLSLAVGDKYNASYTIASLTGQYNITFFANDTLGNSNTTETTFFVSQDAVVPVVSLETTNHTNTTNTTPAINFNFTDNTLNASCSVFVDDVLNGTNTTVQNGTSTSFTLGPLADGNHSYYVNCTDASANVGMSGINNITIDSSSPNVLVFNSPAANANLSGAGVQVLNVTVNDTTLAVGAVQFNVSNGSGFVLLNASNPGGEFWNASLDLSTLVEENHTLQVLANDTLGNLNRSESIFFVSDGTAPNVSLESVNGTNTTDSTPAILFNFTDNVFAFASCSVFVDDVLNGTNGSVQNGTSSGFTLGPLADGNRSYYVNCTDGSSNVGMSGVNNITIDTLPPSVTDLRPVSNTSFNVSDTLEIAANISDATSFVDSGYVNITFPNGTVQQVNLSLATGSKYNVSFTIVSLTGQYNITFFANDSLGNSNTTETTFFVSQDVVAPNVSLESVNGTNTTDSTPAILFNFTDSVALNASCSVFVDDVLNGTNASVLNATSTTFVLGPLADGNHSYYVNCTDASTNVGMSGINNITIDSSSPNVLVFNSPSANANLSNVGTQVLNVTVNDTTLAVGVVQFNVSNGSGFVLLNASNPGGEFWNASLDLSTLVEENHTLQVLANDTLGNLNRSEFVFFVSDGTAPTVSLETVNGTNTTNTTPAILFNFTDNVFAFASCSVFVDDVLNGTNGTVQNGTSSGFTLGPLADGNRSYYVNCTDGSSNVGMSGVNNINVDTGAPGVTTFNTPTASSFHNESFVLNVTVTGGPITVQYRIENGSNASDIIVAYTTMSNPAGSSWNATINTTALAETNYTIRINATDATANSNTTETLVFGVDTTDPNVTSVSCNTITAGASQSCSCSATDNSESYGGSVSVSISSADTSTVGSKTVTCTATDLAGLTNTSSASYTVNAAAATSGGGGGGGAAGASGRVGRSVTGQFSNNIWTTVFAGEEATATVENGEIGLSSISFMLKEMRKGITLNVKKSARPLNSPALSSVYKYVEIETKNLEEDNIDSATIKFKVKKSWLTQKDLEAGDIQLLRLKNNKWEPLVTRLSGQEGEYATFSSETQGFTFFAIAKRQVLAKAPVIIDEPQVAGPLPVVEEPIPETTIDEEIVETPVAKILIIAAFTVFVILVVLYTKVVTVRRKR